MANKKVKFELTAVDKTKAAFNKVTKGLAGVGSVAGKASMAIGKVGLAATGAAIGIALFTKKSFDYIDTLGKTASRTGIATDTLQAFQLAAIESGTTIEQTQKGLEKFARSIGDAGRGLKTQADIFRDLGVEIKNQDGSLRSYEEILFDVAEGLGELGSEAERATALANLFGRAGIQFSEIFRDGADGLQTFIDRANDLGIILDRDTIKGVEKFNDTVSVIKLQVGAFANNITSAFVPALQLIAEKIGATITANKDAAGGFDALGKSISVSVLKAIKNVIISFNNMFDSLRMKFVKFQMSGLGKMMFGDIVSESDKARAAFIDQREYLDELTKAMRSNSQVYLSVSRRKHFDGYAEINDEIMRVTKSLMGMNKALEYDPSGDSSLTFINELIEAVENGTLSSNEFFESFQSGMVDNLNPLQVFVATLEDLEKTMQTTAVNTMKKFEDAIVDGLKTGKLEFESFATYVVEQLARIAIQQMVLKPLTGAFGSFFDGFGDLFSADGGGYTGMGARAGGVDGKGGFPAILHPNETVIDHTKGQGMGATVNFNISTVDAAGFDQLLTSRKGLITQIINNAMNTQGKMGIA
jgi:hypothetical protein